MPKKMRYRILLAGEAMGPNNRMIYMTGTLGQAKWRARQQAGELYEHIVINIFEDETHQQFGWPVAIKSPHGGQWIDCLNAKIVGRPYA